MRLEAYGTSPHGLGLTSPQFWFLCDRELSALEEIQQAETRRWAITQALTLNMHIGSSEEPFIADDFLGTGNRKARKAERFRSDIAAKAENSRLAQMKPGDPPPADIPAWAL